MDMTNTKQNKANLQSSAKGREKSPVVNDKIIAVTIDKADATESKDVAKTQREKDIEVNQAKLKTCIGEAVEYLSYTGPKSIHTLRQFLSELNVKGLDYGDQGKALKLRKDADEIMEVLYPVDFAVEQLNKKHAVLRDKVQYMTFDDNGGGFYLMERKDLINLYENKCIKVTDPTDPTKAKDISIGNIWLKAPNRREVSEIVFIPRPNENESKEILKKGQYNLWQGFRLEPRAGNGLGKDGRLLYWDHVEEVICAGDNDIYWHVRRWISTIFQNPAKLHTVLVIQGSQGSGKDTFVKPLGHLLDKHYYPAGSIEEIEGRFDWHFKDKILISVSEAEFKPKGGGKQSTPPKYKSRVTASYIPYEQKFKDPLMLPNYAHFILLSNSDQPIVIEETDRRHVVLKASDHRAEITPENTKYFDDIYNELDNGGYAILLYDLLHEPLEGFNPKTIPFTEAKQELREISGTSADRYFGEALLEGKWGICSKIGSQKMPWETPLKAELYQSYKDYCEENNEREVLSPMLFFPTIKNYISQVDLKARVREDGKQKRIIKMPDLEECRKTYCTKIRAPYDKIFKVRPESV